jgi:hypothetical protein
MRRWFLSAEVPWLPRALHLWGWAALAVFTFMLTHRSDTPSFFGRYSTTVASMLFGLLLAALAAHAAAFFLSRRTALTAAIDARLTGWRRPILTWAVVILAGLAMVGVTLRFLGDHLPTYAALRAFITLSILLAALFLLRGGSTTADVPVQHWAIWVLPALAIPLLVAIFAAATFPPPMRTDEALFLSAGINLRDFGGNSFLLWKGIIPENYQASGVWMMGMPAWLTLAGEGLAQGRQYMLLAGGLSVVLTWIAAARLYDRATAWVTALILAFVIARLGFLRPDMFVALYLSAGLVAYAYAQGRYALVGHFLAGFFVGFSIDAAPIAYLIGVSFGVLYLARLMHAARTERRVAFWRLVALGTGGFAAIGVYALTRIGASYVSNGSVEGGYVQVLWERVRTLTLVTDLNTLLTALAPLTLPMIIGAAVLLLRPSGERGLVVVTGVWLLLVPIAAHYFPPFYAVHGVPLMAVLAGVGVTRGLARWVGAAVLPGAAVVALLVVWLSSWLVALATNNSNMADVIDAGREIAQVLPEGSLVLAAEPYYFGMLDGFKDTFLAGSYEQSSVGFIGRSPEETWEQVNPNAIIFSENWSQEPAKTPALLDYMRGRDFRLVGCWNTLTYGWVELWANVAADAPDAFARCPAGTDGLLVGS